MPFLLRSNGTLRSAWGVPKYFVLELLELYTYKILSRIEFQRHEIPTRNETLTISVVGGNEAELNRMFVKGQEWCG